MVLSKHAYFEVPQTSIYRDLTVHFSYTRTLRTNHDISHKTSNTHCILICRSFNWTYKLIQNVWKAVKCILQQKKT